MRPITFVSHPTRGRRRHYVEEEDVRIVLDRLPGGLWERLRGVRFNDRGRGRRCLGYVSRGRDEISLCALPERVSLAAALFRNQCPGEFGASRGRRWPELAVRRFMLYDVLLHELGHLQVIVPKARSSRRKFAHEAFAQRFADRWRRELWSRAFDHPDPVHNPPSAEEMRALCVATYAPRSGVAASSPGNPA
ncbi:hypothetical protein OJF2_01580 [Aquisphaera giovannonii]|uniref:Uncharacterized protein n=1 Tax=Aquisphaera giovannonii TaxID=406548 RepID=A0A5B9VTL7_9BACT|nr:hypothetical protein [Aquisphaera giovannonii]QEH31693.1 hypothetical protein OJF2_01580 [Aquisphaera giovannonii]